MATESVGVGPEAFAKIISRFANMSRIDAGIWHTIYYTASGEYVAQCQDNVLDDSGGCFYSVNPKFLVEGLALAEQVQS